MLSSYTIFRLVRIGGIIQESPTTSVELTSSRSQRTVDGHRPRMVMDTPRRVYAPDKRIPSMVLGAAASPSDEHEEIIEEEEETEEVEESETALADNRTQYRSMFARVSEGREKYAKKKFLKQSKQSIKSKAVETTKPSEEVVEEEKVDPNVDEQYLYTNFICCYSSIRVLFDFTNWIRPCEGQGPRPPHPSF